MNKSNNLSIGIDLVELTAIQAVYDRQGLKFCRRVLTAAEMEAYLQITHPHRRLSFLAKHFAAKEAILKACGTGLAYGMSWQDISIAKQPNGAPDVVLSADFAVKLAVAGTLPFFKSAALEPEIIVTWSDTEHYVIAQAMVSCSQGRGI